MATTIAPPSAAAAPAASSAPAPSSAPVSSPIAAPAAAPPAAPPATATPVAAPSPAAAPAAKPEPKASDFSNDAQGQEEFLNQHQAWEREQTPAEAETPAPVEETKPAEEETKPVVEETKEAKKETEPDELAEPVPVTPEIVSTWLEKSPELKAALEAAPAIKGQIFQMARVNAKAAPLLEIFPNAQAGKFANDTANQFVGIRSSFRHAVDNPETFPAAFAGFAENFMVRDKDGNPVLDREGNETFEPDFHMLNNHIVEANYATRMEELEKALKGREDEDSTDNTLLGAYRFIVDEEKKRAAGPQAPSTANLTPEQKAWQEQMEADFKARGEKLEGQTKAQTAAEKKAERAAYTKTINTKIGRSVGARLDAFMAEKAEANVFLPSYVTDAKDKDGHSIFGVQVFNEFMSKVTGVAYLNDQIQALERLPPSPESEKARVDFFNQLIDDFMPDIMERHLRQVQRTEIADRKKREASAEKRKQVASVEPAGGSTVGPQAFTTPETAMAAAYKTVDAKYGDTIDRVKRTELALNEMNRLTAVR